VKTYKRHLHDMQNQAMLIDSRIRHNLDMLIQEKLKEAFDLKSNVIVLYYQFKGSGREYPYTDLIEYMVGQFYNNYHYEETLDHHIGMITNIGAVGNGIGFTKERVVLWSAVEVEQWKKDFL